jgi:hypothetical protein
MYLRKHLMVIRPAEATYVLLSFGHPESCITSRATHEDARKITKRSSAYANEGRVRNF